MAHSQREGEGEQDLLLPEGLLEGEKGQLCDCCVTSV